VHFGKVVGNPETYMRLGNVLLPEQAHARVAIQSARPRSRSSSRRAALRYRAGPLREGHRCSPRLQRGLEQTRERARRDGPLRDAIKVATTRPSSSSHTPRSTEQQGQRASTSWAGSRRHRVLTTRSSASSPSTRGLEQQGFALGSLGTYEEAIRCYDKAISINPTTRSPGTTRGSALHQLKNIGRRHRVLRQGHREASPTTLEAWNNKGNALYTLRKVDEGHLVLRQGNRAQPALREGLLHKGSTLAAMGKVDEPSRATTRPSRSTPTTRRHGTTRATRFTTPAASRRPSSATTWRCGSTGFEQAWNKQGQRALHAQARRRGHRVLQQGHRAHARLRQGVVQPGQRAVQPRPRRRGRDLLRQGTRDQPRFIKAWSNKGVRARVAGALPGAIACYDAALDIDADFEHAWNYKARAFSSWGSVEESITVLRPRACSSTLTRRGVGQQGPGAQQARRHQDAILCFDRAIELQEANDEAWYHKGLALAKLPGPRRPYRPSTA